MAAKPGHRSRAIGLDYSSFVRLGGRGSQPASLETAGQPGQDTHMSSDNINIKLAYSL